MNSAPAAEGKLPADRPRPKLCHNHPETSDLGLLWKLYDYLEGHPQERYAGVHRPTLVSALGRGLKVLEQVVQQQMAAVQQQMMAQAQAKAQEEAAKATTPEPPAAPPPETPAEVPATPLPPVPIPGEPPA
jgi:septum formation inhibitor MinC